MESILFSTLFILLHTHLISYRVYVQMIKECQTAAQLRKLVPKKCEKPVKFKFILPASGNYIKTKNKSEKFKVQNPKRKPKTRKPKLRLPISKAHWRVCHKLMQTLFTSLTDLLHSLFTYLLSRWFCRFEQEVNP